MLTRQNSSLLRGVIRSVQPDASGTGTEITLEVTENRSPSLDDDFLRSQPGTTITLFSNTNDEPPIGELVEVNASLQGGPFGQRAVARKVRRLRSDAGLAGKAART